MDVATAGARVLQAPSAMVNVSVARRYARALLEASAPGALVGVAEQLSALAGLVASNPALADVIVNPAYSRAQRHGVVDGLIQLLKVESTVLRNFLRLLVDRKRLAMLPDIARLFRDMADEKAGRVRGTVVSAISLDPQSIRQLESTLSKVVQKQVVLETRVDSEVLGGVSTQVGSVVFDGTLRSQLDDLKRALQS
jgi:F-type H+-transporting ATPase subunit delta